MKKIILKTKQSRLFLALTMLLFTLALTAQSVTVYIDDVQAELGGVANVDVRVADFQDIAGIQFSVNWDKTRLSFVEITNIALGATSGSNFNTSAVDMGKLGYILADMSLQGFNLEDEDILFTLKFNITMPDNSATPIVFSGDPVPQVIADVMSNALDATYDGGQVVVGTPSSLLESIANDPRFVAMPNPFQSTSQISYLAAKAGRGELSIFATNGQKILTKNLDFLSGNNTILLEAANFPSPGVYLLRLHTNDGIFSRKLIFTAP